MQIKLSDYALGAIERRHFECQAKIYEFETFIQFDDELTTEEREYKQNELSKLQEVKKQLENDIEVCKHIQKMNKIDLVKLIKDE